MRVRRCSGQVAVFLSIVLLAVLLVSGVLVDASRLSSGKAFIEGAVRSSARSALANYGSSLKEGYGIFALPGSSEDQLEQTVTDYLEKNLKPDNRVPEGQNKPLDIYGFKIESVSVTPVFNLSENSVFRQQVLEYMKYRAPKEIVDGFIDRLSAVRETGRMSEAYNKKVKVDKLLGKMDKSQQKLKKTVDGSGNSNDKFINGFNASGNWSAAFQSFNSICAGINSLREDISAIDGAIEELQSQIGSRNDAADDAAGDAADDAAEELSRLLEEKASAMQVFFSLQADLGTAWHNIRFTLTGDYIKPNNDAINEVNSIIETGKKAESALQELEEFMNSNFSGSDMFSKDFAETTALEIEKFKSMILSGNKASLILDSLSSNTSFLNELTSRLDKAWTDMGGTAASNPSGLPSGLLDFVKNYKNVGYDYDKPQKGDKKDDPRNGKAQEAKETLLDRLLDDIDYRDNGVPTEDLPSQTKVVSKSFDEEDAPYMDSSLYEDDESRTGAEPAGYSGNLENVGENIELFDEDGTFEENALSFLGDIGKAVSGDLSKLRDNIYINEYIMGTFKNAVPVLKDSNNTAPGSSPAAKTTSSTGTAAQTDPASTNKEDTDLSGVVKSQRDTFYQAEAEYILHGSPSEKANKLMTKGQILLVRFGLDTMHVYMDPRKKEEAAAIAAAVAGWWTGGAGIPILTNLIICGWGMGEAIIDLKDIMDGRAVPIIKQKGDWKLDIGIAKGGSKTDAKLCFNYYDYLRLFLLVMDENKKLGRMEDLIQLNMQKTKSGFKMSQCNTYVRVEALVSMKYLFLTQPFVPADMKTQDGRRKFRVLVYEGY